MPKRPSDGAPYATRELAKVLAQARQNRGLSQRALGERLHVPQSHISRIERGMTDLRISSLIEMARHLDLEVVLVPKQVLPALRTLTEPETAEEGFLYRLSEPGE
jgi:HTH-type transcriptional regulator/antitoxin HipB